MMPLVFHGDQKWYSESCKPRSVLLKYTICNLIFVAVIADGIYYGCHIDPLKNYHQVVGNTGDGLLHTTFIGNRPSQTDSVEFKVRLTFSPLTSNHRVIASGWLVALHDLL